MNLNIEIPEDVGNVMRKRAEAAGIDLETFVGQVVIETAKETDPEPLPKTKVDEFVRRQNAWVKLHPRLDHAIDDSRDSFYAGRE